MPRPTPLTVLYGGTFDPVHNGHLAVARDARDTLEAIIRLMPAPDPPHRRAPGASAQQRARMLDLAVAGEEGLLVDRREFDRQAPSYSAETLRRLRAELGDQAPVALLIGSDSLCGLAGWKDWQALFDMAHFVIAERAGNTPAAPLPPQLQAFLAGRWVDDPGSLRAAPAGKLFRLGQPLRPESASDIRERIAAGRPWRHLVPEAVAGYTDRHRLYAGRRSSSAPL
ncbi:MAG: nicotinate-nucleotide adenylyltransferase [Lysobacter sp.]|nr:nicotinate-nucleotide adenylyltransferase [Lysobacter sp.]MDQ3268867.1 nicotinate-nucleotide adenylyltransferase [Pseudomonadota bacterium]